MLRSSAFAAIVAVFGIFVPGLVLAQTPDGETPAVEDICSAWGFTGKINGLCNAYCEAMDCDSADPQASEQACERVMTKIEAALPTDTSFPTCEDSDDDQVANGIDNCPDDWNPEQVDTNGSGTGDVCEIQQKTVFVTSTHYFGDTLGGLQGADDICQGLADDAGLSGVYKAWLSDDTGAPATRFAHATVPYVRTDSVTVADSWSDLITLKGANYLLARISVDENGNDIGGGVHQFHGVWSNTSVSGEQVLDWASCGNWSAAGSGGVGIFNTPLDSNWTHTGTAACNSGFERHLYCFEQ